jgi:inorganic pyrophosphatase
MIQVFIEAEAGSPDKNIYNEHTYEHLGVKRACRAFPYPYGFIPGTVTDDDEAVDCYIITEKPLKAGRLIDCVPVGLLEFFEGDELDHKVIAALAGENVETGDMLRLELSEFIYEIFTRYPEITVRVGEILSKQAAEELIAAHRK